MQPDIISSKSTLEKNGSFLAVIPARGGSKGIPKKNIRLLAGKYLIEYTIDAAKRSKFINRIIVSTDDAEIAEVSKKTGAEVIIRPSSLAQDDSPVIIAIEHVLSSLRQNEEFVPDIIILLQPTSPLRTTEDIDGAIMQFLSLRPESLISVSESEHSPYWCFTLENERLIPVFDKKNSSVRRQELPKTYRPNGAIYISTHEQLKRHNGFMTDNTLPYIMPAHHSVDIDIPLDFSFAEFLIGRRRKNRIPNTL